jgi:endonuclease III related protein
MNKFAGKSNNSLIEIYEKLLRCYGPQHWWPAETAFEVMIGAILTQSAAWTNVEKAIRNLKSADLISPVKIREIPPDELAGLIRPCGYYNAKAQKLKTFVKWLGDNYQDDLKKLFANDISSLRQELLSVHGIGEETADSIILYAGAKPIFVIDAYTKRIISRLGLMPADAKYGLYQSFFMNTLPKDTKLFNEYHALLVKHAKQNCCKYPICDECCLKNMCPYTS